MPVTTEPSALVNAAGALLFALVGAAIVALAKGSRRGRLVGWLALAFGLTFIVQNLRPYVASPLEVRWVLSGLAFATSIPALLLARELGRPIWPRIRGWWVLGGLVLLALTAARVATAFLEPAPPGGHFVPIVVSVLYQGLLTISFLLLLATCGAHARWSPPEARQERRAVLLLAVALGLWTAYQAVGVAVVASAGSAGWILSAGYAGIGVMVLAVLFAFVPPRGAPEPHLSRAAWCSLLAAGLAAALLAPVMRAYGSEFGSFGVLRTIGAALLARAVVRHDLLGVQLPQLVLDRGALGAGALAVVFIVAQIAQNFLEAQYGLLMGGVIAGAFLFAAQPIQRAIERGGPAPAPAHAPGAHDEDAFRDAVRLAYKDRRFDPDEEVALANLADRLGLSAKRATQIRHEIEHAPSPRLDRPR